MKPHNRKVLQIPYTSTYVSFQPITTLHNSTSTTPPPQHHRDPQQPEQQYSNPPFDSSIALTVLVLLTALCFMGFFSIYMRKLSNDQSLEISSHHHRRSGPLTARAAAAAPPRKGLDPGVVKSLPVYAYYHGDAKYQTECAICLGEFEEKETVKLIPYCEHVFHLECIDTWLKMHLTCPVCRGAQFLKVQGRDGGGGLDAVRDGVDRDVGEMHARSTVDDVDTSTELGTMGVNSANRC